MHLIVDSNYLFHRSKHALKDTSLSSEYVRTEIVFGFLNTLLMISKRFVIDDWTFVWDSALSWREMEYPTYKAERKRLNYEASWTMTVEELELKKVQGAQMSTLKWDVLPSLGFKNNFHQTGAEGDDLIAMIAKSHPDKEFLIVATDKDLYQLLSEKVSIYNAHTEKIISLDSLKKQYGVTPDQWALAKCIGGCATDEVQGIKGCADPGRSESSRALGYLKGEITKGAVFDRIESKESQEIIERNKKLIILPHKNTQLIELTKHSLFAKDFIKTFEKLEFHSFLRQTNFKEWTYSFNLI